MSTDAGSAAAPEDTATQAEAGERPGLESSDPQSDDSATSTPDTADRDLDGSAAADEREGSDTADSASTPDSVDAGRAAGSGDASGSDPKEEGFVTSMLRDATITGMPGETGAPPAEPHAPQAQQEGDEPVGSEPPVGDNPHGAD